MTRRRRDRAASDLGRVEPDRAIPRRGRNDPCGCGSGKKYKKCCAGKRDAHAAVAYADDMVGFLSDEQREALKVIHTPEEKPRPKPPEPKPKPKRRRKPKTQPKPARQEKPAASSTAHGEVQPMSKSRNTAPVDHHPTRNPEGQVERITPAIAKSWLADKNYSDNRSISHNRVKFYARQMASGRWRMNGEPIIFDTEDMLLNGQHRLHAIIESNKSIDVFVIRGVSQEAFTTMDQGYTRSGAQVLSMKGLKNSSTRAAICRAMYVWEVNNGSLTKLSRKVSPDELLLVQECYPDEINNAVAYADQVRREVPMSCGMIGLGHILVSRAKPRKAEEFLQVFSDGLTTSKGHPALTLRSRFIKDKMQDRTLPPEAQFCAFVRAWNYYDQGKTMRTILVKRNPDGEWVLQAIRGLGRKRTGGEIK